MKKLFCIACSILIVALLVGCSGAQSDSTAATSVTTLATSTTNVTEVTTTAASTLGGVRYGDYLKEREEMMASKKAENEAADKIEEQKKAEELTVIDNDICLVRYSGKMETTSNRVKIGVYLENKTRETNCEFRVLRASINGIQVDAYMSVTVKPGKKANDKISLEIDTLKKFGFTDYTSFEIELEVRDSDDWLADPILKETIEAYKEDTATKELFSLQPKQEHIALIDNDYVTISVIDQEDDAIRGYVLWLYVQNKSEVELSIMDENVSVNGYMIDPLLSLDVLPGKSCFARLSWDADDLEANDIEIIEEIEIELKARDNDNWFAGELFNEMVTFNP